MEAPDIRKSTASLGSPMDRGSMKSIWQQRLLVTDELGPARLAVPWLQIQRGELTEKIQLDSSVASKM